MTINSLNPPEEAEPNGLMPDTAYEIWSPYDAAQAAETLLNMLEADQI